MTAPTVGSAPRWIQRWTPHWAAHWRVQWTPRSVGTVAAAVSALFVVVRWLGPARGELSRFILASRTSVTGRPPHGLQVFRLGYDGQFYYRLALDPWQVHGAVSHMHLDSPLRAQRIGYPILAWLLSLGGQPFLVPFALVAINVAAIGVLAGLGARFALACGGSAATGWLFVLFPGYVVSLSRDLTEIVSSAFLLAAVLALHRQRWMWCAVALSGAVLTRESTMVFVPALLLWRIWQMARRRSRPGLADLTWLLPLAAFVGWQLYCRAQTGVLPVHSDRGISGSHGRAFAHTVVSSVRHLPQSAVYTGALAVMGVLMLACLLSARRIPLPLGLGVLFATLLTVSLSTKVWNGDPAEIRVGAELATLGVAALVQTRSRWLPVYAVFGAVSTAGTMVFFAHQL